MKLYFVLASVLGLMMLPDVATAELATMMTKQLDTDLVASLRFEIREEMRDATFTEGEKSGVKKVAHRISSYSIELSNAKNATKQVIWTKEYVTIALGSPSSMSGWFKVWDIAYADGTLYVLYNLPTTLQIDHVELAEGANARLTKTTSLMNLSSLVSVEGGHLAPMKNGLFALLELQREKATTELWDLTGTETKRVWSQPKKE